MMLVAAGLLALSGDPSSSGTAAAAWRLRSDPITCMIETQSAEPKAILAIETTAGSDLYRVAIASAEVAKSASLQAGSMNFAPSRNSLTGLASAAEVRGSEQRVIWMQGLGPALLQNLADADSVEIATKSGAKGSISVQASSQAVEALRRCNADKLTAWGADPSQFARGGKLPEAIQGRDDWVPSPALLAIARRSKLDLEAFFKVGVLPDGVIDECVLLNSAIDDVAAKLACKTVVGRRLFAPAQDASGRPVRGAASFRIKLFRRPL